MTTSTIGVLNTAMSHRDTRASSSRRDRNERLTGVAITFALHAAFIWTLLQFDAVRQAIIEAAPIMVKFITPPAIEEPPKPKPLPQPPQVRKRVEPPPLLTTKAIESPSPIVAPEQPKAPVLAPAAAPRTPLAETTGAAPAPITPPEFDAAYLRNPPPAYPSVSRRYREQGKVVLRVYVSATGTAEKVEILTSSGSPRLDQAAQEAVRSWHFVPARQGETPVPAWVNVPIKFSLEG